MIWSASANLKYYGSTTQPLSSRMSDHRKDYKRYKNGNCRYTSSYDVIQHDDAKIELVELYPCESKSELERREGEIIREHECVNLVIAGRTAKQYYQDNRESILEKKKEYHKVNRESILQKKKEYHKVNRESISEKRKIRDSSIRINCPCGGRYRDRKADRTQHFNTNRHKKYQSTLDDPESH